MAGKGDSVRAILFALGANFAIFLAKTFAAVVTNSSAMTAEAVHSLADCGNQGLLLLGLRQAKRPPSPDYPLGYGKAIYFWSFLVALLLFSVGGMFSLYEGIHKFSHPEELRWPWLAVGVLSFGIVAEMFSMVACMREVNRARGTDSLWHWFRQSRQSELIVIFGEDLAALFGLVFALVAVVVTMITGNPVYDAIGTIAIGVLLIVVAVFVAYEVKALLIGQGVDPQVKAKMLQFLDQRPEIRRVYNLLTLQLGNDVMVAVKAEMSRDLSTKGVVEEINTVEAALRKEFPDVRWCFFEPDIED
jgi:cation diffusion facilitator family transporter